MFARGCERGQGLTTKWQLEGTFQGIEVFRTLTVVGITQLFACDKTQEILHEKE